MDTNIGILKEKIIKLEERILKLESLILQPAFSINDINGLKKISTKEFLLSKKCNTATDKVLALGYFLEIVGNMVSFNVVDLEDAFRSAREKVPGNINDLINKNIDRGGLLDEAKEKKDGKKAWYLTSTGEKFVEGLSK